MDSAEASKASRSAIHLVKSFAKRNSAMSLHISLYFSIFLFTSHNIPTFVPVGTNVGIWTFRERLFTSTAFLR